VERCVASFANTKGQQKVNDPAGEHEDARVDSATVIGSLSISEPTEEPSSHFDPKVAGSIPARPIVSWPRRKGACSSSLTRSSSGAFESVQRTAFSTPVVERSAAGAKKLGEIYWREVQRSTLGVIRVRRSADGVDLRLLGVGPPLLRFGRPEHAVSSTLVRCLYPIRGGLLVRTPGGSISFTQTGSEAVEVTSAMAGFFPRLAASRQGHRWRGLLYPQVQARLHLALGRRYFARLRQEARR